MLNLVIGGVGETHQMAANRTADLRQRGVPQFATGHLETLSGRILMLRHVHAFRHKPDSKQGTGAHHKFLIRLRFFPSQSVVDVRNNKPAWIHPLNPDQCVQHPHRVTAAGNGNNQRFICRHATSEGQCLGHAARDLILSRPEMFLKIGGAHLGLNPAKKLAHPTISPLGFKNVGAVFC